MHNEYFALVSYRLHGHGMFRFCSAQKSDFANSRSGKVNMSRIAGWSGMITVPRAGIWQGALKFLTLAQVSYFPEVRGRS